MNKKKIFYITIAIIIIITAIAGIITKGKAIKRMLFTDSNDSYMDFYNSMMYRKEPYDKKVIYPPLANIFYYLISEFIPRDIYKEGSFKVRSSQMGRFVGGLYIAFSYLFFAYAVIKSKKGKIEEQILLVSLLALTPPFMYQLERGNLIFLTCSFIMLFLCGYNSPNTLKKHLSFICLSIATTFKIYPAILTFLILKEKRWKDAIICILYEFSFFVLPIISLGGFSKFTLLIRNILNVSKELGPTVSFRIQVSISNLFNIILKYTKLNICKYSLHATIIILLSGIILLLFADYKEKWKYYAIPTTLMITVPNFSFIYSVIFITIPLIQFLDSPENNKKDIFYSLLFVLLLAPIPVKHTGYIESFCLIILMTILWTEGFISIYKKIKYRKSKTEEKLE